MDWIKRKFKMSPTKSDRARQGIKNNHKTLDKTDTSEKDSKPQTKDKTDTQEKDSKPQTKDKTDTSDKDSKPTTKKSCCPPKTKGTTKEPHKTCKQKGKRCNKDCSNCENCECTGCGEGGCKMTKEDAKVPKPPTTCSPPKPKQAEQAKEESSQKSCCAPKDEKTDKHKTCNKKGGCDKDCDNCTGCGEGGCGEGGCGEDGCKKTKEEPKKKSCCEPKDEEKKGKTCKDKGKSCGSGKDCSNCESCSCTGCDEGGCKHTKGKDKSKKSCCASKEDEDSSDIEERDFSQFPDPDDTDYDSSDYIELNDDSVDDTYSDSGDSVDMTRQQRKDRNREQYKHKRMGNTHGTRKRKFKTCIEKGKKCKGDCGDCDECVCEQKCDGCNCVKHELEKCTNCTKECKSDDCVGCENCTGCTKPGCHWETDGSCATCLGDCKNCKDCTKCKGPDAEGCAMCDCPTKYDEMKIHPLRPFPSVFLEVGTEVRKWGIIEIELFTDTPKTCENFRQLCTGEAGIGEQGKKLHYKGSHFHRVVKNLIIQGGDIINGNGSGGDSIYGKKFMDENYKHRHDKGYLVAMANCGEKDTNSSQFYITLDETPWLDDFHVVFGSVISGFKVIDRIAKLGKQDSTVTKKIYIRNCGETKSLYVKGQTKITKRQEEYTTPIHFYTSYFIPEAQTAWIALNMKRKDIMNVVFHVDGKIMETKGGKNGKWIKEEEMALDEKYGGVVPTLKHGKQVRKGATDCIEYIDKELGVDKIFYSRNKADIQLTNLVFSFLNDRLKPHFYSMLLYQDVDICQRIQLMFLEDIKYLVRKFRGPYFLGNDEKICDIIMAPWFERMTVLVHYRGFVVPEGEDFENWHEWYNSVIYLDQYLEDHLCLAPKEKLIKFYANYANGTVRNNHYKTYYKDYKPKWLFEDSKKLK